MNAIIISLDQCAVSSMEPNKPITTVWEKIKQCLIKGVDEQRMICPIPYEIICESIELSQLRFERLHKLQLRLSRAAWFTPFSKLASRELLKLVRRNIAAVPYSEDIFQEDVANSRTDVIKHRYVSEKTRFETKKRTTPINYTNKDLSLEELWRGFSKQATFRLYDALQNMKRCQPLGEDCREVEICMELSEAGISNREIQEIREHILNHAYSKIPLMFYCHFMMAQIEYEIVHSHRGRQTWNDLFDVSRIATALDASQMYVCDRPMAQSFERMRVTQPTFNFPDVIPVNEPERLLSKLESL